MKEYFLKKLLSNVFLRSLKKNCLNPEYSRVKNYDITIPMSDGIKLHAVLTCPDISLSWPVIFLRNPYCHMNIAFGGAAQVFAKYGYAFLLVDVRGTQKSEGNWLPFENERKDGHEVVDFIAKQKWCNGNIGTYGLSYSGHTQWSVADYDHPALKTFFISVFSDEAYELYYHRGMFRIEIWSAWAAQMMGKNRYKILSRKEDKALGDLAYQTFPQNKLGQAVIGEDCSWHKSWIAHPNPDDKYWTDGFWGDFSRTAERITKPVYFQSGWFDIFSRSTMDSYLRLPDDVKKKSRYIIGPWSHGICSGGALKYPDEDKYGPFCVVDVMRWFDYMLKGKAYIEKVGTIEAYYIGENKWKEYIPECSEKKVFWLNTNENITTLENAVCNDGKVSFIYDPKNPVKSRGGTLIGNHNDPTMKKPPECACTQPDAAYRNDVISFVSEPVDKEFTIIGKAELELYVESDKKATCFSIKLIEERKDGTNLNIREDITDIRWLTSKTKADYIPGEIRKLSFDIQDIAWKFNNGSKLRIDISSSNYPAYHIHPNSVEPWGDTIATEKAIQTIYTGINHPSRLTLKIENM